MPFMTKIHILYKHQLVFFLDFPMFALKMEIKNPAWNSLAATVTVGRIPEKFQVVADAIGGRLHKRS